MIDNYIFFIIFWNIEIVFIFGKGKIISLLIVINLLEVYNMFEIIVGIFKVVDGKIDLYYCLIKLVNFDFNKKYLVVVYVYGGLYV